MRIEEAEKSLGELARHVYQIAHWLTGHKPEYHRGWYKSGKPIFIYFRTIGDRPEKYPPRSVHVVARQSDLLADLKPIEGNNYWGADYSVVARPGKPKELAHLIEFIGRAYRARY